MSVCVSDGPSLAPRIMLIECRIVCTLEKLFMCGDLNPRMFRYAPPDLDSIPIGASFWRGSKKTKKQGEYSSHHQTVPYVFGPGILTFTIEDAAAQESFWEEMNRREMWDRTFEKRIQPILKERYPAKDDEEALEEMNVEKEEEDQRRRDWDAKHLKAIEV
jgi:hypothetical protein